MTVALQHPFDAPVRGTRTVVGRSTGTTYTVDGLGRIVVANADAAYLATQGWLPVIPGSGINVVTVDFGAFPGSLGATTTIASVTRDSTALVEASVVPIATADHTADEHAVDAPIVSAQSDGNGNLVISAYPNMNVIPVDNMMPWGKWSVAWSYLQ